MAANGTTINIVIKKASTPKIAHIPLFNLVRNFNIPDVPIPPISP